MFEDDQAQPWGFNDFLSLPFETPNPSVLNQWTKEEDMALERALALYPNCEFDWDVIASHLPGKSPPEIKERHSQFLCDMTEIEAGRVEPPSYCSDSNSKSCSDAKKWNPWTHQEHILFLLGLEKFGKGDWRSISRNYVKTRTPTQVASHAQKYFQRQNSDKKTRKRKRKSILDTTVSEYFPPANHILPPQQRTKSIPSSSHTPPPQHHMSSIPLINQAWGTFSPPPPNHVLPPQQQPVNRHYYYGHHMSNDYSNII